MDSYVVYKATKIATKALDLMSLLLDQARNLNHRKAWLLELKSLRV